MSLLAVLRIKGMEIWQGHTSDALFVASRKLVNHLFIRLFDKQEGERDREK